MKKLLRFADIFYKAASEDTSSADLNSMLSEMVEKLNEYGQDNDIKTGKEALKLLDSFRALLSEHVTNQYLAGWKPKSDGVREKSDRDRDERVEQARQDLTIEQISELLRP